MTITPTTYTIADFCSAHDRNELVVNNEYQRSDKVWPPPARSFLIETILLGYPMPKLYLYQVTDIRSRTTRKEIVDGQQRSRAIFDFYAGALRLTRTLEAEDLRGKIYDELNEDQQGAFLNYALAADLFVGATPEEIREVFRRMNSYTVPLNPEEKRHAIYQGSFKWFIYRVSREYEQALLRMGVLSSKAIVRMADAKLLTEVSHAALFGIKTTNARSLDELYRQKDKTFPEEEALTERLTDTLDQMLTWEPLFNTALSKSYIIYSVMLATMHCLKPLPTLANIHAGGTMSDDRTVITQSLSTLANALESREDDRYEEFVSAGSERTNVAAQRETRVRWFCRALNGDLP
jgi:Protein of unknown function DUF262